MANFIKDTWSGLGLPDAETLAKLARSGEKNATALEDISKEKRVEMELAGLTDETLDEIQKTALFVNQADPTIQEEETEGILINVTGRSSSSSSGGEQRSGSRGPISLSSEVSLRSLAEEVNDEHEDDLDIYSDPLSYMSMDIEEARLSEQKICIPLDRIRLLTPEAAVNWVLKMLVDKGVIYSANTEGEEVVVYQDRPTSGEPEVEDSAAVDTRPTSPVLKPENPKEPGHNTAPRPILKKTQKDDIRAKFSSESRRQKRAIVTGDNISGSSAEGPRILYNFPFESKEEKRSAEDELLRHQQKDEYASDEEPFSNSQNDDGANDNVLSSIGEEDQVTFRYGSLKVFGEFDIGPHQDCRICRREIWTAESLLDHLKFDHPCDFYDGLYVVY
uniref:Uncharacterized protein n=1 Tax=Tongliao Rhabd tick virus 1 TaxID=2972331 RepID=A0A9E8ADA0_9RHAB|nr:MAG: hypothetical protein [Tongliao Rhabd tick virus 1]